MPCSALWWSLPLPAAKEGQLEHDNNSPLLCLPRLSFQCVFNVHFVVPAAGLFLCAGGCARSLLSMDSLSRSLIFCDLWPFCVWTLAPILLLHVCAPFFKFNFFLSSRKETTMLCLCWRLLLLASRQSIPCLCGRTVKPKFQNIRQTRLDGLPLQVSYLTGVLPAGSKAVCETLNFSRMVSILVLISCLFKIKVKCCRKTTCQQNSVVYLVFISFFIVYNGSPTVSLSPSPPTFQQGLRG